MKDRKMVWRGIALAAVALCLLPVACRAQDTVTIPKSRLEELERKEAELRRLQGPTPPTNAAPAEPAVSIVAPPPVPPAPPAPLPEVKAPVARPTPATPLSEGEVIEAGDLAAQYRTDASAADGRYYKKTFTVRGEVIGFEKPLLTSNYKVLLKTAEPQTRVICDFLPPQEASAVFTVNHGLQMVALVERVRVPLVKVGDAILVQGQCRGWHDQAVTIQGRKMSVVH